MQALLAGIAIALLLSTTGHAQTRKVIAPKPAVPPTAAAIKVAPHVLPAKPTAERRAYSDLVDHVSKTMDDFADDNTSGNQGRDHLGDLPADASTDDASGKAPVATKTGKRP